MIEETIDYIQFSSPLRESMLVDRGDKAVSGFGFYTHGYEDAIGVRRFFGNPNSNKCFTIMSGTPLHNMRAMGWNMGDIVEEILMEGANITRIDLCVTEFIEENLITVKEVAESFSRREFTGTLQKYGGMKIVGLHPDAPEDWNTETTETFYIGSLKRRGKNGIFRVYDKGLELGGFASEIITRLELEERGENAHNNAKRFVSGKSVSTLLNSRISSKSRQWERVIGSEKVDMSRGQELIKGDEHEAMVKRKIWLLKQVAPALASVIEYDNEFAKTFHNAVLENLTK